MGDLEMTEARVKRFREDNPGARFERCGDRLYAIDPASGEPIGCIFPGGAGVVIAPVCGEAKDG